MPPETLRNWVKVAEVDAGLRPGITSADATSIAEREPEVFELRRANATLKRVSACFAAELDRPQQIVAFIDAHRQEFGVESICRTLQVVPPLRRGQVPCPLGTGGGRRRRRPGGWSPSTRQTMASTGRKMWRHLHWLGHPVGRCRVERLMRAEGLHGVVRGKARRTAIPAKDGIRSGDLVIRALTAASPNQLWVADFTYVRTRAGSPTSRSSSTCTPG